MKTKKDNKPLVKFHPMNMRSFTQLLLRIITMRNREAQPKELICVINRCNIFSVYLVRTIFSIQASTFSLLNRAIVGRFARLSEQMGQLVAKFKEFREKLESSHEKAKHGKYS